MLHLPVAVYLNPEYVKSLIMDLEALEAHPILEQMIAWAIFKSSLFPHGSPGVVRRSEGG